MGEDKYGNDTALYETQMTKAAMASLQNIFGDEIPYPVTVKGTMWGKYPYSHGSYSYNKFGMDADARSEFKSSLEDRLYFAGEATSYYWATTHGAYLSGRFAAKAVLNNSNIQTSSSSSTSGSDSVFSLIEWLKSFFSF